MSPSPIGVDADIPVYRNGEFVRYVPESEARAMLSRKEAALTGSGTKQRRLHLLVEQAAKRERALTERDPAGAAISATYEEELYCGSRKDGDVVVTAHCVTLKKARAVRNSKMIELVPYREGEGFRRRRFNPDRIGATTQHYRLFAPLRKVAS